MIEIYFAYVYCIVIINLKLWSNKYANTYRVFNEAFFTWTTVQNYNGACTEEKKKQEIEYRVENKTQLKQIYIRKEWTA